MYNLSAVTLEVSVLFLGFTPHASHFIGGLGVKEACVFLLARHEGQGQTILLLQTLSSTIGRGDVVYGLQLVLFDHGACIGLVRL